MKNKMLFQIILFALVLLSSDLYSQDVKIKVKKGSITLNGKTTLNSSSPVTTLNPQDKVLIPNGSVVSALIGSSFTEIPSGKIYAYNDIKKMPKQVKKSTSLFDMLVANMQVTYNQYGSSTRGAEGEPNSYSPIDSPFVLQVLNDTFKLRIGNNYTKLLSPVSIIKKGSTDYIYNQLPENKEIVLYGLMEGEYAWSYKIEYIIENKKTIASFSNKFLIPSAKTKNHLIAEYQKVEKEINNLVKSKKMSAEMAEIQLEEYKLSKQIFYRK
jgi:hypothetical protein